MDKKEIRKKLIYFSLLDIFSVKELVTIASILENEPHLTAEEFILSRNVIPDYKKRMTVLDALRNRERKMDFNKVMESHDKLNIKCCTILDEDYPLGLKEIYRPPAVLYYQGNWKLTRRRRLGIVGSRKNTTYGKHVLAKLLPDLIQKNVTLISGLAAGIDEEVHRQSILLKGDTIAVIGTGIDCYYPKDHVALQQKIGKEQLLISEYPLGKPPARYHFPMRNRIIAGLSHGVLVIEAKERSGSLITANVALQENREVFAVPGSILSESSTGTNQLIRAGAKAVLETQDIFDEMAGIWLMK